MNRPEVQGTVVAAFVVESHIRHRGLMTVANAHGPFQETILLEYPVPRTLADMFGTVEQRGLDTRYEGWPVETIDLREVRELTQSLQSWIAGSR